MDEYDDLPLTPTQSGYSSILFPRIKRNFDRSAGTHNTHTYIITYPFTYNLHITFKHTHTHTHIKAFTYLYRSAGERRERI